jgi:hypothetical protein
LLESCEHHDDCASELCTSDLYTSNETGVCTTMCREDDDCALDSNDELTCREVPVIRDLDSDTPPRQKACVLPCTESEPDIYECRDGVRLFCDDVTPRSCDACGCREGTYCDSGDQQCKSFLHGGDACTSDSECLSRICRDGVCTAGQGDPCDDSCDAGCGGQRDAFYCMPACIEGKCPTDLRFWECVRVPDTESELCARVCSEDSDCLTDGDVCEPFASSPSVAGRYFTGYCRQLMR